MSRKAKYATLTKYQPYIDIIRKDLGLPDDLIITIKFRPFRGRAVGGYANWPNRHIELNNQSTHEWTISALMHEFKHIQQYYTGKLDWIWITAEYTKAGCKVRNTGKWMQLWKGQLMTPLGASVNPQLNARYRQLPWEREAYAYQDEIRRLFPRLTVSKKLIGISRYGTKFYRI